MIAIGNPTGRCRPTNMSSPTSATRPTRAGHIRYSSLGHRDRPGEDRGAAAGSGRDVRRRTSGAGRSWDSGSAGEHRAILGLAPREAFGVWAPAAGEAYGLRLLDHAAATSATPGHTPVYQALDVTVLQKLILEQALAISPEGLAAETNVAFFKDMGDAFARLEDGGFQIGFFMNPTGLEQVREAAFARERMPHKATFFYPKLPTGLVFQDLGGSL